MQLYLLLACTFLSRAVVTRTFLSRAVVTRTFLSRAVVTRMRQTRLSSPDQGIWGYKVNFDDLSVFVLIVCCSPLSRTPSHPHPFITHITSHRYGASGGWLLDLLGLGAEGSTNSRLQVPVADTDISDIGTAGAGAIGGDAISAGAGEETEQEKKKEKEVDETARGTVVGTSAHSIGTAGLLSDGCAKAAGVASVAMFAAGVAHAVACAVPGTADAVKALAGM